MKKFSKNLNLISALLLAAVLVFGIYLVAKNAYQTAKKNSSGQTAKFKLPQGLQTYNIAQASDVEPHIIQASIDPLDVHTGFKQKLSIVVTDDSRIESVVAKIETDHGVRELPLKFVRVVADSEIAPSAYSVDASGHLVINEKLRDEQLAANSKSLSGKWNNFLSSFLKTNYLPLNNANASGPQKLLYEGSWIVRDTHDTTYHTTFVVSDAKSRENSITLAWTDACNIPQGGAWTIGANCSLFSNDGVDNGNATVSTFTLTINNGVIFAYNSGNQITISSNGSIALGTTGQIKQTNLWEYDFDGDGYRASSANIAQDTTPGTGYRRRNLLQSSDDCDDGNVNAYVIDYDYADGDSDGEYSSSGQLDCVGQGWSPAGTSITPGGDCNDGNSCIWQTNSDAGNQCTGGGQFVTYSTPGVGLRCWDGINCDSPGGCIGPTCLWYESSGCSYSIGSSGNASPGCANCLGGGQGQ
jgi:hypothetical protein